MLFTDKCRFFHFFGLFLLHSVFVLLSALLLCIYSILQTVLVLFIAEKLQISAFILVRETFHILHGISDEFQLKNVWKKKFNWKCVWLRIEKWIRRRYKSMRLKRERDKKQSNDNNKMNNGSFAKAIRFDLALCIRTKYVVHVTCFKEYLIASFSEFLSSFDNEFLI